jgi:hypothetical protein
MPRGPCEVASGRAPNEVFGLIATAFASVKWIPAGLLRNVLIRAVSQGGSSPTGEAGQQQREIHAAAANLGNSAK